MRRVGLLLILANFFGENGVVAGRTFPGRLFTKSEDILTEYDYVIIGGGTSGMVVANRLTEDPKATVLVIEAGGFDRKEDWTTIPLISSGNIPALGDGARHSKYDWNMTTIPQQHLQNRSLDLPAGKVIGGSSVLNGMIYDRGSTADYDKWEALGNPGWNFNSLLPYFKKAEHFFPPDTKTTKSLCIESNSQYHGIDGFVQVSFPKFVWPVTKSIVNAMKELKIPIIKDAMGGVTTGGQWIFQTLNPYSETRSTSEEYLKCARERPNLHLLIRQQVTRINLFNSTVDHKQYVSSVEYAASNITARSHVTVLKEAILAAGALHTPAILQLSGIGFAAHLSHFNITPLVDLPGCGSNLQDQLQLYTGQSVDIPIQTASFSNATYAAQQLASYKSTHSGPMSTIGSNMVSFLPLPTITSPSSAQSILAFALAQEKNITAAMPPPPPGGYPSSLIRSYFTQHTLLTSSLRDPSDPQIEYDLTDISIAPALLHPFSRGAVLIHSTDAFIPPIIDPRHLSNPLDMKIMVEAFKFARKIRSTHALQYIGVVETFPGEESVPSHDEEKIEMFIRRNAVSCSQHAGTAAMMPRELGGVVDSRLKVYDVEGLRVVDASVIPILPGAHLQGTIYGVAERAADLIKGVI